MADCGTDTGYKAHRTRREDACDGCKTAHADHQRTTERRAYQRAVSRAFRRLARAHRGEYAALLAEERAKEVA